MSRLLVYLTFLFTVVVCILLVKAFYASPAFFAGFALATGIWLLAYWQKHGEWFT